MDESMESVKAEENSKIVRRSVLESFSDLADTIEKKRIDSALQILKHLLSKKSENEEECLPKEVQYACSRLIRGLGSSRDAARKGYYAAFVAFLINFPTYSITDLLQVVDKELEMGKFSSKGEEGEVCFGRILAFGAVIRSGHFAKASSADQLNILNQLIQIASRKSYLPQLTSSFLFEVIEISNEAQFNKVLWHALKVWLLKPWSEQTNDSLHLLLKITNTFPKSIKKTELKGLLGAPKIIRMDSLVDISSVLFNSRGTWQHPVFESVCKELGASPDLAIEFWHSHVDLQLLGTKSSRSKGSLAIDIFRLLITHLSSKEKLPQLLTPRFISLIRQRFIRLPQNTEGSEDLRTEANAALVALVEALKSTETSDPVRSGCLERIVTSSRGEFGFDQITKSNVVHSIASSLKSEGLNRVADLCRAVITGDSHPCKGEDDESNDSLPTTWLNKDRIAAIHLLTNLSTHPAAQAEFRAHQILLFLEHAFFPPPGCTSLCPAAKESLLRCLGASVAHHTSQPLAAMRQQLSEVVAFIDNKISSGQKPIKSSKEAIDAWKRMMAAVENLKIILSMDVEKNSKASSQKHFASVLLVLFMQLGLQLFLDPELAADSLQELHICVEKAGLAKQKNPSKLQEGEPLWVEVVSDLFLSLLSQNSSMLRGIVGRVFNALCPLMTESALLNLVNVLDCSSDLNPLSRRSQQNTSEDSESEEEMEEVDKEGCDEDSEKEDDDDSDLAEEDTVSDRVRAAVQNALGESAEITDTESVDVDDIGEEEGKRLDEALSQAFAALNNRRGGQKGNLTKKQSRDNKELTHFRVRVLDLVEAYIQSEQSMSLTLGLISPLFHALEACLKDVNQKPLEARLRSTLRKLSSVKKFNDNGNVDVEMVSNLLKTLIEKGNRTAAMFIDINVEVSSVSSFLVRCSQLLPNSNTDYNGPIALQYHAAMLRFFEKRDCLLPPIFFTPVLKTNWPGNFLLWPYLVSAAFKIPSVRPFRKTQALTLLKDFASNERLLLQHPEERAKLESVLTKHAVQIFTGKTSVSDQASIKQRFIKEFLLLMVVVCQHCKDDAKCKEIQAALIQYSRYSQTQQVSRDIKKLLRRLQNILDITDDAIARSEFHFVEPRPVSNGSCNGNGEKKKRKSQEQVSKVTDHSSSKRAKKEAKELRLNVLSSGLDTSMGFSDLQIDETF